MALVAFLPPVKVEVPHEPGNFIEFRKPSSGVVREARKAAESEGRRGVRDFGAEIVKAFTEGDDDDKAARRARKLDQLKEYDADQFDRAVLLAGTEVDGKPLAGGIVAWGGPAYIGADGKVVPVSTDAVNDLDEETARWAHEYVIGLMKPPTPEADKSPAPGAPSGA